MCIKWQRSPREGPLGPRDGETCENEKTISSPLDSAGGCAILGDGAQDTGVRCSIAGAARPGQPRPTAPGKRKRGPRYLGGNGSHRRRCRRGARGRCTRGRTRPRGRTRGCRWCGRWPPGHRRRKSSWRTYFSGKHADAGDVLSKIPFSSPRSHRLRNWGHRAGTAARGGRFRVGPDTSFLAGGRLLLPPPAPPPPPHPLPSHGSDGPDHFPGLPGRGPAGPQHLLAQGLPPRGIHLVPSLGRPRTPSPQGQRPIGRKWQAHDPRFRRSRTRSRPLVPRTRE